jgi:hypothetical protein
MLRKIYASCFVFGGGRESNTRFILLHFSYGKMFSPLSPDVYYHIIYFFAYQGGGIALELSREVRLLV